MRQWFSIQREAFRSTLKLRRALTDAGAFDNLPFIKRLWLAHLQFIPPMLRPTRLQVNSTIRLRVWRIEELYCRTADRLFGGSRLKSFVERCERRSQETLKELQESERKLSEIAAAQFDLRLLKEALQNPNFVMTNRPHPDRP